MNTYMYVMALESVPEPKGLKLIKRRTSVFAVGPTFNQISADGLEFRILCLEGSVISYIHYPQAVFLAQFSLYVHKGGLNLHSFQQVHMESIHGYPAVHIHRPTS